MARQARLRSTLLDAAHLRANATQRQAVRVTSGGFLRVQHRLTAKRRMVASTPRLNHARKVGFVPIDLTKHDRLGEQVAAVIGEPTVDSVIDVVGFEAKGHGGGDQPAIVLNQAMEIIRPAGAIGIPGLYVTEDPGAHDRPPG